MKFILFVPLLVNIAMSQFNSWMADPVVMSKTLSQLTIPGTHDAGSYSIDGEILVGIPEYLEELDKIANWLKLPISKIIKDWSLAQDQSLYQQFSGGIRYADIRACWYNGTSFYPKSKDEFILRHDNTVGEWYTHHDVALGTKLQFLLDDAKKFLDENPSEILVLEVSHMNNKCPVVDYTSLIQMIENTFGSYLYPRRNSFDETIQQMVEKNQRLVVTLETNDVYYHPLLWYGNAIINSYANSDDLENMESYNKGKVDEFLGHSQLYDGQLFKLSWDLTPVADTILQSILPWKPSSLLELADTANKNLDDWFDSTVASYKYPIFGNILIIDHYETSEIVKVVQRNIE